MRYMGGKFRQSKAIAQILSQNHSAEQLYIEPFCGALGSAERVVPHFREAALSDASAPVVNMWNAMLDGWVPPAFVDEETYAKYAARRHTPDAADPMTAWCGYAVSFGGKWFGGYARFGAAAGLDGIARSHQVQRAASLRKIEAIRMKVGRLDHGDYRDRDYPDGSVVYLDPPYANRTRAHHTAKGFDSDYFWSFARALSQRCFVYVSEFAAPPGWDTVHSWGDTVVRHNGGPSDGTCERLFTRKAA